MEVNNYPASSIQGYQPQSQEPHVQTAGTGRMSNYGQNQGYDMHHLPLGAPVNVSYRLDDRFLGYRRS